MAKEAETIMREDPAARPFAGLCGARARRWAAAVLVLAVLAAAAAPAWRGWAAPTEGEWEDSLAGRLLVASEEMRDPTFSKTVIYMIEHNRGGAMGLVVNTPLGTVALAELFDRYGLDMKGVEGEITVYFGGPVDPGRGFLLHSSDVLLEGSVLVDKQVAVTSRPDMLRAIARGEGPAESLFTLGYSGWAPGQLESELARNSWFVIPADVSLVFASDPAASWSRAAARRSLDL